MKKKMYILIALFVLGVINNIYQNNQGVDMVGVIIAYPIGLLFGAEIAGAIATFVGMSLALLTPFAGLLAIGTYLKIRKTEKNDGNKNT